MSPNRTLEIMTVGEPSHHDRIVGTEARSKADSGPEPGHGRRFVSGAWVRPPRRSRATAHHSKTDRLSANEERSLAERIKAGDADAAQKLITANLGLVLRSVRFYKQCGVPLDDLVQEGNLGLIRAARHFDPSTHTARFATYATYWIRCFIVRALASHGSLVHLPEESHILRLRYRRAVGELRARGATASGENGANSPSLDEIARYLGVTPRRLKRARLTQSEQSIYLRLGDLMVADEPAPAEDLVINEDRALVHAALQRLSPFEAWVICERFGLGEPTSGRRTRGTAREHDPAHESSQAATPSDSVAEKRDHGSRPNDSYFQRSYIEMGEDCGLSVHRIRQVEKTALDKLRAFLGQRIAEPT
jgi:RNA polymerase primary sigma factor